MWLYTMAGQLNKLKQKELDAAKSKERAYSMSDGGGLVVLVQPSGAKWWRFRYRHNGIPNMISLGTYPDTDLKTARNNCAAESRQHIQNGRSLAS